MRKSPQVYLFFLLSFSLASCNVQKEVDHPVDALNQIEKKPNDFDPYFKESNYITSPYGPTSITRNIMQDKNGDIWLATWEGIIRYGLNTDKIFTNFTNKDSLRRWHIFSLLEAKDGDLWFGTIGAGVYRYDGKTFTNYTSQDGLMADRMGCFYQDRSGKMWIGSEGGISVYDEQTDHPEGNYFYNFTKKMVLVDNDINSIVEDDRKLPSKMDQVDLGSEPIANQSNGKFWIGTRGAAYLFDPSIDNTNGAAFSKIKNKEGWPYNNVRCIIKDRKGNIWLAGEYGLSRYDGNQFIKYSNHFVGYVYEDSAGNIWTTSAAPNSRQEGRLSRYAQETIDDPLIDPEVILQKKGMFFGIFEDTNGGIWMGTLEGVVRYDGENFDWFRDPKISD